jgi:hypothetical protein
MLQVAIAQQNFQRLTMQRQNQSFVTHMSNEGANEGYKVSLGLSQQMAFLKHRFSSFQNFKVVKVTCYLG